MVTVKVSWSGGKDSTAAMILHHLEWHHIKAVCYIPMLTDEIPLIRKCHYDFILDTADLFRQLGHEVTILRGKTYWDITHELITRGERKGHYRGYSIANGFCDFRNLSKIKALRNYDIGYYDYEDIGIASDEVKRLNQLNTMKRSILAEKGLTEKDAKALCIEYDLLSPNYQLCKRDGCLICPNASLSELAALIEAYPQAEYFLRCIDRDCRNERRRNGKIVRPYWDFKDCSGDSNETFGERIDRIRKEGLL